MLSRPPRHPLLRPLVQTLWCSGRAAPVAARELVLPTGAMHVVFRLGDPLRLFGAEGDASGRVVGTAVVGGARAAPYLRDVSSPVPSVGAQLRPGAAGQLLGFSAAELAGQHIPLDALWGSAAADAHDRLLAARSPAQRLDLIEQLLLQRLQPRRSLQPAVAHALARFDRTADIGAVVAETGISHRRFIESFREAVGLQPKLYCRILRFQRALHLAAPGSSWAEVALAAGYSDQPHLCRDFTAFAGISPGRYRRLAPRSPNHVPVA